MLSGPERFAREIAALSATFKRAADVLLRLLTRLIDSFRADTPETPEQAVREAESGVSEVVESLKGLVREWVAEVAPKAYIAGSREAGGEAEVPDDFDEKLRASLSVQVSMLASRLLQASRDMEDDALGTLREIARRRLEAVVTGQSGIGREAAEFRRELEERGIRVRDRAGRELQPGPWCEMALRTASGELFNSGHLETASQLGAPGVRVRDGGGPNECEPCAKVDGEAWTLSAAMRNRLEHPRCRRTFSSLSSDFDGEFDRE